MKVDMRSIYRFDPIEYTGALPSGGDVYYECECGSIISSVTFIKAQCECGNMAGKQGDVTIKDAAKVKPLRGKLR
ncbi:MAG TPA: hypothetical protein VJ001_04135 [Rhodocyclaceae bacterium]|nr:hypothetical protein [Rhodocyclaceae bacterium]